MRIFLLTGEPSGDLHGANLARALRELDPQVDIVGVGGTRMRQAGIPLFAESEHWGAIGIAEALRKVPFYWQQLRRLARELRHHPPDVLVPIDFGAFNVRLLQRLQGSGIRTVYFIPPGCWSRHRAPGQLPFLVDAIATPFPWSADNLRSAQAPAKICWVGHPLMEYTRSASTRDDARRQLGISDDRPVIALLPGSRRSEIHYLLTTFFATMQQMTPAPVCLLSVAPSIGKEAIQQFAPANLDIRYFDGMDYQAIPAADAALVASGTATLELACLNVPMVVAYRGSFGSWLQYQFLVRTGALKNIALPNLLAADDVVPEMLQEKANPASLAAEISTLLQDSPQRRKQLSTFSTIRSQLGDGTTSRQTAELVLEIGKSANAATRAHDAATPLVPTE
ncbi:MAG TPA: lipid-A-disaccharide synthase [Armatimonadota bacterium]|nr:lipid-A-disaccharide synthase [Armatimonadota bacterium]